MRSCYRKGRAGGAREGRSPVLGGFLITYFPASVKWNVGLLCSLDVSSSASLYSLIHLDQYLRPCFLETMRNTGTITIFPHWPLGLHSLRIAPGPLSTMNRHLALNVIQLGPKCFGGQIPRGGMSLPLRGRLDSRSMWLLDQTLPFDFNPAGVSEDHCGLTSVLGRSFYSCLNFTWRDCKAEFINLNATES